jgi:hypothetical protein
MKSILGKQETIASERNESQMKMGPPLATTIANIETMLF